MFENGDFNHQKLWQNGNIMEIQREYQICSNAMGISWEYSGNIKYVQISGEYLENIMGYTAKIAV